MTTQCGARSVFRKGPTFELVADVALALTKLGTELDLAATIGGVSAARSY